MNNHYDSEQTAVELTLTSSPTFPTEILASWPISPSRSGLCVHNECVVSLIMRRQKMYYPRVERPKSPDARKLAILSEFCMKETQEKKRKDSEKGKKKEKENVKK